MEAMWKLIVMALATFNFISGGDGSSPVGDFARGSHHENMRKMQAFKESLIRGGSGGGGGGGGVPSSAPPQPPKGTSNGPVRVYRMSDFGGDPTGQKDSTEQIRSLLLAAAGQGLNDNEAPPSVISSGGNVSEVSLTAGQGSNEVDLEGGTYRTSQTSVIPCGQAPTVIKDGNIIAGDNFTGDNVVAMESCNSQPPPAENTESLLMDEISSSSSSASSTSSSSFSHQHITFQNIMIDSNHKAGGISINNALRTSIENCYFSHFSTTGINVHSSSQTYIRNSFVGQHINAGRDPRERNFTGTAINLSGNGNVLTDVVVFSAAVGVAVSGQGNTLSGVHCYNKATTLGGTGIYLKKSGSGQNRIINSYLDYTGIVAEDPLQLQISNSFFRGDAFVALKSIKGVVSAVNIVDNTFSGSKKGTGIVQLEQSNGPFNKIDQVVVDGNSAKGMSIKGTVAKGVVQGNGTSFSFDFNPVLLFPNRIRHVQYSFITGNGAFPNHVLRSVSNNRVVVATNVPVSATVFITVDQN